jgi:TPR repeat protein
VNGIGCGADPAAGASIVKRAADRGTPTAHYSYAFFLESGTGVAKDLGFAVHFYELAIDGAYAQAKAGYEQLRGSV